MVAEKSSDDKVQPEEFVAMLPNIFGSRRREGYPSDLIGASIVRLGTIPSLDAEGGGLVIDYTPLGSTEEHRAVFEFSDVGMWVHSSSSLGSVCGGSGLSATELIGNSNWIMGVELAIREISNDDLSKTVHSWSGYLPSRIEEAWERLSLSQRAVALIMAEERYSRDYSLDE